MAAKVRKNDLVEVISGDHKGEQGRVLHVDPEGGRVVVEGVNMVYRHLKQSRRNRQGGRIRKEAPIHVSNVLPIDPKTGRGRRVHFEMKDGPKGGKRRVSAGGTVLEETKAK